MASELASGVTRITATGRAFAALKSDGSVVTWGDPGYGGDSSAVASELTSGVVNVFSNAHAFAALKSDGSVVTWGNAARGADSSAVASEIASGVTSMVSNSMCFAALKGSLVCSGHGICDEGRTGTGACTCDTGYSGADCREGG